MALSELWGLRQASWGGSGERVGGLHERYLRRSSARARKWGDRSSPVSCAFGNWAAKRLVLSPAAQPTSTALRTFTQLSLQYTCSNAARLETVTREHAVMLTGATLPAGDAHQLCMVPDQIVLSQGQQAATTFLCSLRQACLHKVCSQVLESIVFT